MCIVQGGQAVTVKGWKKLYWSQRATAECEMSSFAASCVWGSDLEQDTNEMQCLFGRLVLRKWAQWLRCVTLIVYLWV